MALLRTFFHALPVDPTNGIAALQITDAQTGGVPGWEIAATANDGGNIIGLTEDFNQEPVSGLPELVANPIAVGVATVTIQSYEDQAAGGNVQTGTLTCTVTSVGGKLQAAWSSGSITLH